VALITGTGGGQGRAAALRFARDGAVVVGCDVNAEANEETVALLRAEGLEMTGTAPVDLSDSAAAREWVDGAAASAGAIDIVYNNASATRFAPIDVMSEEDWSFVMRNEVDLVFFVTKWAWPHLVRSGRGVIINTASIAGMAGSHDAPMIGHAASKGAVIAMTRQMAVEGAAHGIRANSISPGAIETPGTKEMFDDPNVRAALLAHNLIKRPGLPDDIASLAAYMASDAASYMTGSNVVVDGGVLAY
jgi:NAD(P)-dependent dehydrogenase (short-subunit alcohol dehydrogenase family)